MSMPTPAALVHHADRDVDHNFLPDFAWGAVGGLAGLAACVLLLLLTPSWGGGASIASYSRELAAGFLAGFLVVLVARSLSTRTR